MTKTRSRVSQEIIDLILFRNNHEKASIIFGKSIVSFIMSKCGANKENIVKGPKEFMTQYVHQETCFSTICCTKASKHQSIKALKGILSGFIFYNVHMITLKFCLSLLFFCHHSQKEQFYSQSRKKIHVRGF